MAKELTKGRKGIFFTFIAITVMAIFILVFTPQADINLQKDNQAIKARITSIDNYVSDLQDRYFETVMRAVTYKAALSLIFYVNTTGSYITGIDAAFYEVMLNGTINGTSIDSITGKKIMENSTLANWSKKITETASDTLNVNTTIIIKNVSVSQSKPWSIDSSLHINFTVNSTAAKWEKSAVIRTSVSIEGFNDPYYLVNTNKAYTNRIKASSVTYNQWNITKVREHLRNGTYVHWENSDAPSFLARFTGDTANSSCCGIESLVNPNKISPSDQRESYVDFLFWNHTYSTKCTELYNITNPPSSQGLWDEFMYFKLDLARVSRYNITSVDAVVSC